jgi:hypothetical protein
MSCMSIPAVDNATGATAERSIEPKSFAGIRSRRRRALRATWIVLVCGLAFIVLAMSSSTSEAQQVSASRSGAPSQRHPIVDGHHVQPHPSDFNGPEFTPEQSKKVDELYSQLLRMHASEAARAESIPNGRRD